MRIRNRRRVAVLALGAAVLAGCSTAGDDADTAGEMTEAEGDGGAVGATQESAGAGEDGAGEDGEARAAGDDEGATGGGDASGDGSAIDQVVTFGEGVTVGRSLARTATITLEVQDVAAAAQAVRAAAVRAGGYVESQDVDGGELGSGRLTLRVPSSALDATIEEVADAGHTLVRSTITSEDLTDQLVDLRARIANLRALEAELRELLTSVENADPEAAELLTVYDRVNGVRAEIERLEAQRAAAADRVSLATINVDLVAQTVVPEVVEPAPESTIARAWQTTREAFGDIADALIWLGVTILPVLLVAAVLPGALLWLLVRTVRDRERPTGAPAQQDRPATPPAPVTRVDEEQPVGAREQE